MRKLDFVSQNNFLAPAADTQTVSASTSRVINKYRYPVIGLSLSAVALAVFVSAATIRQFNRPKVSARTPIPVAVIKPSPTITSTPTPDPAATSAAVLSQLKLQILNGSGKAGLAKTVAEDFQALGFIQITTGNSPTTATQTSVSFADTVTQPVKDMIMVQLQNQFVDVATLSSAVSDFAISITLGTAK